MTILEKFNFVRLRGHKYYYLGGNDYIKVANVSLIDGKSIKMGTLRLNHNSYVYDQNGNRLKNYRGKRGNTIIANRTLLHYAGKVELTTEIKDYYYMIISNYKDKTSDTKYYWLPYKNIKGHDYYYLGDNGYIKAANVDYIDGYPVYYNGTTYATVKRNTHTYDINNIFKKGKALKKGQKFPIDRVTVTYNDDPNYYAHIKNTKNEYIMADEYDSSDIAYRYGTPSAVLRERLYPDYKCNKFSRYAVNF
ncbi:SLAP domain-containing protein [Lactobacillus acetotolerans]|jgi:hypothetical protein|uniref:SLAP domain-containing protein n=1 Tax=Lactobacillus acetotolerans TaxID=1600 RepID=UPI00241C6688|nr:SLAP domain-containing protein [Lactobacillus acetotolerans]